MRFASIQKILLREERTIGDRLQLALIFSILFGASAGVRILSHDQYPAIDLAMEGAVIAGMLGGYVSGLITGLCVSRSAASSFCRSVRGGAACPRSSFSAPSIST